MSLVRLELLPFMSEEFCVPVFHISHLEVVIFILCYHSECMAHLEKIQINKFSACVRLKNLLEYGPEPATLIWSQALCHPTLHPNKA